MLREKFLQRAMDKHQSLMRRKLAAKTKQLDKLHSADRFLKIVDKYTDIKELTSEIIREFVDKIVIHERSGPKHKKNYTQQIDV